jgi:hypothetical protein
MKREFIEQLAERHQPELAVATTSTLTGLPRSENLKLCTAPSE